MFTNLLRVDGFDLTFAVTAAAFNLLIAGIFIAQKCGRPRLVRFFGTLVLAAAIPFGIVFIHYLGDNRPNWVLVYFGFIFLYLLVELLLDFIFKVEFRKKLSLHIPYIILEYIALFGLIGIAFQINQGWGMIVSITFWLLLASLIYLYSGRKHKPTDTMPR